LKQTTPKKNTNFILLKQSACALEAATQPPKSLTFVTTLFVSMIAPATVVVTAQRVIVCAIAAGAVRHAVSRNVRINAAIMVSVTRMEHANASRASAVPVATRMNVHTIAGVFILLNCCQKLDCKTPQK
jgi:hypothetical protein